MKKSKNLFILILIIILLTSCNSNQSTSNTPDNMTDEPNSNNNENDSHESTVQEYKDKISELESQLTELEEEYEILKDQNAWLLDESTKTEEHIREEGSFGEYIQNLPLKEHAVQPKLYTGDRLYYEEPQYVTVVDMPLDNKDLEQSSDSAIRLNAEYLFKAERY
ncbi:hypothetical protein AN1V17_00690 [Vallitalea sediminicola]